LGKNIYLLVSLSIGKKIHESFLFYLQGYIEIAKGLNSKVYVTDQKRAMLETFRDEELNQLLTSEPQDAQVHVIPLWHVLPEVRGEKKKKKKKSLIYAEYIY
jgi:hypothetical protein